MSFPLALRSSFRWILTSAVLAHVSAQSGRGDLVPAESAIGSAPPESRRLLLNAMEEGGVNNLGWWQMKSGSAIPYEGLTPKVGQAALKFEGLAAIPGAKGDFSVSGGSPIELTHFGAWIHLTPEANVARVGFQVVDAEGETLFRMTPANWQDWKWVEADTADPAFEQAYPQPDKNGKVDLPIKGINVAWFAQAEGSSFFGIDGLVGMGKAGADSGCSIHILAPGWGEPGNPLRGDILVENADDKPLTLEVEVSLQRNPQLRDDALPDPILGSDHAQGQPSWVEIDGVRFDDDSLTDGRDETAFGSAYKTGAYTEGFHFVDLGTVREIKGLAYRSGDANWIFEVDVSASPDGGEYHPVPALQELNLHKKWGVHKIEVKESFSARYLRFRYYRKDGSRMDVIRAPAALYVYDGVADEKVEIPRVGELVGVKKLTVEVPPRNFAVQSFAFEEPLGSDAYRIGATAVAGNAKKLNAADYFVMPEGEVKPRRESRFGMNGANPGLIPVLQRLGVGWIRFENMKWRFYNPAPGDFRFDGTVGPWNVPLDDYMRRYTEAGFSVLPYIFQTPDWASAAPEDVEKNKGGYPPRDFEDYGKAIFEAVARYGTKKHPENTLAAKDPKSGLNHVAAFELWNEPNLNDPGWGFFVGPLERYMDLFRVGAEAARKADPDAIISHGGFAGLQMDWVDKLRSYVYPDGKRPIDFTDVINVHFYSGVQDPELATKDPNVYRDGTASEEIQTYEKDLIDLADWRDSLKPEAPIWLTETGYDVGGPIGRTERFQAAKLVRCLMIAFANGVEKVMVYRETGSTPAQHAGAGLLRDDKTLRPSYFTMATLIRAFEGVKDTRVPRLQVPGSSAWMYLWKRPDGDMLTAWTPEKPERLGFDLGRCTVMNSFGAVSEMEVTSDFEVGIFPVYITKIGNPSRLKELEREAIAREEERRKRAAALAKARTYLFDFGSREFVATKKIGMVRVFTPVLLEDSYTAERAFGFVDAPHGKNDLRKWIPSTLEKDSVALHRPGVFRVDAAPGRYRVEIKGEEFRESEMKIMGSKEGELRVALPADDARSAASTHLEVTEGQPVEFHLPAGRIQWITLVEDPAT
jgi:hypothetical protein